ncbi:glycine cleavage system aminomethyltransferase GcvT [Anianabacter salinae]|uniref:glycine cleavage system aminomethyltransferase GcvT n=1 Tax=Anianabacter salinae TaxID=2851023 RepID=UPI00225E05BA|nr:glycine cleavage system aminomethyltransferase GcvT [Anianabacter salinae]MBV0910995.1 glycine cleavage system aminomethyltransferase GcvT [Anianabacter salinae]
MGDLKRTVLHDMHLALGARMVPFAGYDMPVQYASGVMKEHLHTREKAGLFDVSHMGQVILRPASGDVEGAALALEALVPVDVAGLAEGRQRYAVFTAEDGGILDDLMIARRADHLFLVVNAACKAEDIAHLRAHLPDQVTVEEITDRALLALQGPEAERVLSALLPGAAGMRFMDSAVFDSQFGALWVSRSGYTGEDGYEVSVPEAHAVAFAEALLADNDLQPIGLGARDSLRLEAGLCLYGADIDTGTSPVEADLVWSIQKVRRSGGARAGGFPGAETILRQIDEGASRKRVGLLPDGRAPMRAGTEIYAQESGGHPVGTVTSGAFGPSIGQPMSMAYVSVDCAEKGRKLWGEVRGKRLPALVAAMPFHPHAYKR